LGVILRKAAYLIRSKTRIALRGAGIPLSGFVSLPELCHVRGLNVIRCASPNSPEFLHQVQLLGVDLIVVAGFSRILKRPLIGAPRLGCINVHLSLLPLYRGPEPNYWVLANFEQKTGVTIHYLDEGIDSGDIILQREFGIRPKETLTTLTELSARMAAELLREAIPLLLAGQAPRIHQDHSTASYYSFPPRGTITERRERQLKKPEENS
jgi:methionyl-tRNA formyltransferase